MDGWLEHPPAMRVRRACVRAWMLGRLDAGRGYVRTYASRYVRMAVGTYLHGVEHVLVGPLGPQRVVLQAQHRRAAGSSHGHYHFH